MGQSIEKTITAEMVVAYSQCPRKAFLLYRQEKGSPHEYIRLLEQQKQHCQSKYLDALSRQNLNPQPFTLDNLKRGSDLLTQTTLKVKGFEAACGLLTKVPTKSALGKFSYEPTLFVGRQTLSKEDKLELAFVGYVLGLLQNKAPATGRIISLGEKSVGVKLEHSAKTLVRLLEPLQEWTAATAPEPPPLILNKHCPYCPFQSRCQSQAEQEDNLSLLDGMTPKLIREYEKKGIFTVKQLSYLFKPRKRKKGLDFRFGH